MANGVDISKIVSVSSVEPSKKFPGKTLITCDYFGNDRYQFLADAGEIKQIQKMDFNPESEIPATKKKRGRKK